MEKTPHPITRYESDGEYQRDGDEVNSIVTAPSSDDERGATSSSVMRSVADDGSGIESDVGRLNSDDIVYLSERFYSGSSRICANDKGSCRIRARPELFTVDVDHRNAIRGNSCVVAHREIQRITSSV